MASPPPESGSSLLEDLGIEVGRDQDQRAGTAEGPLLEDLDISLPERAQEPAPEGGTAAQARETQQLAERPAPAEPEPEEEPSRFERVFVDPIRDLIGIQEEALSRQPGPSEDIREAAGGAVDLLGLGAEKLAESTEARIQRAQERGQRLREARERGEDVPSLTDRILGTAAFKEFGPTFEEIREERGKQARDIMKGGVFRPPIEVGGELAAGGLELTKALAEQSERAARASGQTEAAQVSGAAAQVTGRLADMMRGTTRESLEIIGEPETPYGIAANVVSRLGLELLSFVGGGQAFRRGAGALARGARPGSFVKSSLEALSNPQTLVPRLVEDLASGGAIDFMIGASAPENATAPFLADLAENEQVREGLKSRGFDPDEVKRKLDWIAEDATRRGVFESTIGTALAMPVLTVMHGAGKLFGRAVKQSDLPLDYLPEVAHARRNRAAQAEPRAARAAEEPEVEIVSAGFRDAEGTEYATGAVHDPGRIEDPAVRARVVREVADGEADAGFITRDGEFLTREEVKQVTGEAEASNVAGTPEGQALRAAAAEELEQGGPRFVPLEGEEEGKEVFRIFDTEAQAVDRRFPAFDTEEEAAGAARHLNEHAEVEARVARQAEAEAPREREEPRPEGEPPREGEAPETVREGTEEGQPLRDRLERLMEESTASNLAARRARALTGQPSNVRLLGLHSRNQLLAVTKRARAGEDVSGPYRDAVSDLRTALTRAGEQPDVTGEARQALDEALASLRLAQEESGETWTGFSGRPSLEELVAEVPPQRATTEAPEGISARELREQGRTEEADAKVAEIDRKLRTAFGESDAPETAESAAREAPGTEAEPRPEEPATEARQPQRRLEEAGEREVGERVPGIPGRLRSVKAADGTELTSQYEVVEAASIRTSHNAQNFAPRQDYPDVVQERRYHDDPDAQQFVVENARELDPDQVLDATVRPTDGPPIITSDGVALSGNARSMMLKRAARQHPETYQNYARRLAQRADDFGLGGREQEILDMDAPVLVRRLVDENVDEANRAQLAELASKFNDQPTRARDVLGEASTRARRFLENDDALQFYGRTIGPSQTLRSYLRTSDGRRFIQRLVDEGTIPQQAANQMRRPDGTPTDEGIRAVERMLFASVVDDPDVLARARKSVLRDLIHAVPPIVKANRVAGWDLGPNLRNTLDFLHRFRNSDFGDFDEFARQQGFFETADDQTVQLARFLEDENRATIKKGFRKFAEDATEASRQAEEGTDLGFGLEPVTRAEAFQKRFVDKVHEPQIPGLRGNPGAEEGFASPELVQAMARSATGAVFGAGVGSLFGDTPEAKRRNAAIFGTVGAVGPHLADFAIRRLSPPEWFLSSRRAEEFTDLVVKGGAREANDAHNLFGMTREAYRRVFRGRLPIDEFSDMAKSRLRTELAARQDPSIMATVNSGSMAHAQQSYTLGPHKPGTNNFRTERGLKQVLEEVGGRMDDLRMYGIARRIVEDLEPRGVYDLDEEEIGQVGLAMKRNAPMTPEEAREVLEDFGRTYREGTSEVAERGDEQLAGWFEEVQRIDDAWWVLLEEEGVIRQGAAARIRGKNRNYWPFTRDVPPDMGRRGEFRGGKFEVPDPIRTLEGSEMPLLDPIETLVVQQFHYSDLIFKQRLLTSLADLTEAVPDNPYMRRLDPSEISERVEFGGEQVARQLRGNLPDEVLNEIDDEVLEAFVPRRTRADDPIVRVRDPEGGVQYYELSDEMVDAARTLGARQIPAWVKMLKPAARWLRTGVTVMPEFQFANMIRDITFVAATDPELGARPGAGVGRQVLGSYKAIARSTESALRGVARLLGDAMGREGDELIELWRSGGGPFGAFQELDRDVLATELQRLRRQGRTIDNVTDPLGALRALGDRTRGLTIAIENGPRLGAFIRKVEAEGRDIESVLTGAAKSRDISVDFASRGASRAVQNLGQLAGFWNAGMQGLDKMHRAFRANPKKMVGTALGIITIPSLVNYGINRNDPDYWQLPLFIRNFYWPVKLPGFLQPAAEELPDILTSTGESGALGTALKPTRETEGGVWLKIPKPFELGWIFGSIPERFLEAVDPKNPQQDEGMAEFVKGRAEELGSMFERIMPIPTFAQPLIENFMNYDLFMGRPIISPYDQAQDIEDRLKGRERASEFAKGVGDVLNVSPAMVDNVINDYFGTGGRRALEVIDAIGRPEHKGERPEDPLGQGMPERIIIGRFVQNSRNFTGQSVTQFYEAWNEANGAYRSYRDFLKSALERAGRMQQMGESVDPNDLPAAKQAQNIQKENLELLLKRDVYNDIAKRLRLLRDQRKRIEEDPGLGREEKRALLQQISMKMGFLTSLATFKPEARDRLFDRYDVPENYRPLKLGLEKAEELTAELEGEIRKQLRLPATGTAR